MCLRFCCSLPVSRMVAQQIVNVGVLRMSGSSYSAVSVSNAFWYS